jgi:hypothetical protein
MASVMFCVSKLMGMAPIEDVTFEALMEAADNEDLRCAT